MQLVIVRSVTFSSFA